MKNSDKSGFWYAFNLTAIILILLFAVSIPLLHAYEQFAQSVDIQATQNVVASAFTPTTFTIDIQNASGTPLNAIEFELHFDPKAVQLSQIVPTSSLCEERFVITNTIDNTLGTALFQCGTITPFSDTLGTVATVYATPLVSGTSSMTFGTSTRVLAHDGMGTDATRTIKNFVVSAL